VCGHRPDASARFRHPDGSKSVRIG
jgi:hypothetical protein